jgi:hypothetical protein
MVLKICSIVGESALRAAVSLAVILVFILFMAAAFNFGVHKGVEIGMRTANKMLCPDPGPGKPPAFYERTFKHPKEWYS